MNPLFPKNPDSKKQENLKCLNLKIKRFFEVPPSTVVKNSYQ